MIPKYLLDGSTDWKTLTTQEKQEFLDQLTLQEMELLIAREVCPNFIKFEVTGSLHDHVCGCPKHEHELSDEMGNYWPDYTDKHVDWLKDFAVKNGMRFKIFYGSYDGQILVQGPMEFPYALAETEGEAIAKFFLQERYYQHQDQDNKRN